MALTKGTNSYVTLNEAEDYFEDRIGNSQWDSANDATKEQALVTAWQILDLLPYAGITLAATQVMAWPRSIPAGTLGADPRTGRDTVLEASNYTLTGNIDGSVYAPIQIRTGQFELALHLIKNPDIIQDASLVQNLTLGTLALDNITRVSILPNYIRRFLAPYYVPGNSASWFLAN